MRIVLLVLFIFCSKAFFGQTLVEDQKSESTGDILKKTSWETFNNDMKFTSYFRITRFNDQKYFEVKLMIGKGKDFKINKGDSLMFELSNGEKVFLENTADKETCIGCGSYGVVGKNIAGIHTSYPLSEADAEKMEYYIISQFKIYTSDSYAGKALKKTDFDKIYNALLLVK